MKTFIFADMGRIDIERKEKFAEKFGDYCLDISKLVFGGIVLAGVMELDVNPYLLFGIGLFIILFATAGFLMNDLFNFKKRKMIWNSWCFWEFAVSLPYVLSFGL